MQRHHTELLTYIVLGCVTIVAVFTIFALVRPAENLSGEANFKLKAGSWSRWTGLTFNRTTNSVCGNGIVEGRERCDKGAQNGACPAECSTYCITNTCGTGGGTGGGGGSFESRCSPDEEEFCKLHPDMSRMVEKPGNGPCPTQMTCYECADPSYEADTWIDECLAPGEEHFSACADLEGTECLRAADATSAANRAGGTLAGEILTQYVGKVTGEPGTYWEGKQWAVGYFCPGNVQGGDPWGGAISCYRCRGGYHFENKVCVPDDGQAACDTTQNCEYEGECHPFNTIMDSGSGWSLACGQVGSAPPQPYMCNAESKGDAIKSHGTWFCCNNQGFWTDGMTDCPGMR